MSFRHELGNAYERQGRIQRLLGNMKKMPADIPSHVGGIGWIAHLYAVSGRQSEARAALKRLREMERSEHVSNYLMALTHAALGEKDEACNQREMVLNAGHHPPRAIALV